MTNCDYHIGPHGFQGIALAFEWCYVTKSIQTIVNSQLKYGINDNQWLCGQAGVFEVSRKHNSRTLRNYVIATHLKQHHVAQANYITTVSPFFVIVLIPHLPEYRFQAQASRSTLIPLPSYLGRLGKHSLGLGQFSSELAAWGLC